MVALGDVPARRVMHSTRETIVDVDLEQLDWPRVDKRWIRRYSNFLVVCSLLVLLGLSQVVWDDLEPEKLLIAIAVVAAASLLSFIRYGTDLEKRRLVPEERELRFEGLFDDERERIGYDDVEYVHLAKRSVRRRQRPDRHYWEVRVVPADAAGVPKVVESGDLDELHLTWQTGRRLADTLEVAYEIEPEVHVYEVDEIREAGEQTWWTFPSPILVPILVTIAVSVGIWTQPSITILSSLVITGLFALFWWAMHAAMSPYRQLDQAGSHAVEWSPPTTISFRSNNPLLGTRRYDADALECVVVDEDRSIPAMYFLESDATQLVACSQEVAEESTQLFDDVLTRRSHTSTNGRDRAPESTE